MEKRHCKRQVYGRWQSVQFFLFSIDFLEIKKSRTLSSATLCGVFTVCLRPVSEDVDPQTDFSNVFFLHFSPMCLSFYTIITIWKHSECHNNIIQPTVGTKRRWKPLRTEITVLRVIAGIKISSLFPMYACFPMPYQTIFSNQGNLAFD